MYPRNYEDMMLGSRTTVLEGDIALVLIKCIKQHSNLYPVTLLTSKTMSKSFSDDAPQKRHCAIGSRTSTTVDPQHSMAKAREGTDGGWRHHWESERNWGPQDLLRHVQNGVRSTRWRELEAAVIATPLPTPLPGDVAGIRPLITYFTFT